MDRRTFIQNSATVGFGAITTMGLVEELHAEPRSEDPPAGPPINCAVIGASHQGREILNSLAKLGSKNSPVSYVCDSYSNELFIKRSKAAVPDAQFVEDYRKVLDDKAVQAVFIATPSHKHRQIVLDSIAAGKHVYCEMPLANDLDEAKAIAKAGLAATTIFQPGLQARHNEQANHVHKFVRSKEQVGQVVSGRAQYHERKSWRQAWPDDTRMKELNWRLSKETSTGLVGEVGIHQIDTATWFFHALPVSVQGYGGIMYYQDGRDVADTVQCVVEYPGNVQFMYDASLISSYEGAHETFYGTNASVQLRDQRAWMFKETDTKLMGWEVFARKDNQIIGDPEAGSGLKIGTGIALVANATKQLATGRQGSLAATDVSKTSLYQAIDAFMGSVRTGKQPAVGALIGYQATVVAHKANEAVMSNSKIVFEKSWFELG